MVILIITTLFLAAYLFFFIVFMQDELNKLEKMENELKTRRKQNQRGEKMKANETECKKAGLNPKEVSKLASRFERLAKDCEKLGITIFCGSSNSLRFTDELGKPQLLVAYLNSDNTEGGCGAECKDEEGLMRGELT